MASKGAIEAGAAYVRLFLKDGLSAGLRKASAMLKTWGASMQGLGVRLMAIGGAMSAPFVLAVKSFAATGDVLNKMSIRTGMAVEALSALAFAAEQSGADLGILERGLIGMARMIDNADRGLSTAVDSLDALGLSVAQLKGKSPENQFMILAEALSRISDPTLRAALAMQVFGKSGQKLIPLMAGGAAGIRDLMEEAERLGRTMTTEQAQAAADLTDAWNRIKSTFQGVKNTIGAALAPTFLALADTMKKWSVNLLEIIRNNKAFIVGAFRVAVAVTAVGAALVAAGTAVVGLGAVLGGVATVIGGIGAAFAAVGGVLATLITPIGAVTAAVAGIGTYFLWSSGAIGSSVDWIKGKFTELGDWTAKIFEGIRNALAAGDIALAGEVLMNSLKLVWTKGVTALTEKWIGFKDAILSVWSNATFKIAELGTKAWAELQIGWAEAVAGMQIAWIDFSSGLINAWETVQKTIGKGIAWIIAKIEGVDPSTLMADVERQFELKREKRGEAGEAEKFRIAEKSRKDIERIAADRKAALDALNDQKKADADSRAKGNSDALAKAQKDLDDARKKLDESLAGAKGKAASAAAGAKGGPGSGDLPEPEDIAQAGKGKISTAGTFAAWSVAGMGATSEAGRTAKATEKTATILERIERKKNAGPVFA